MLLKKPHRLCKGKTAVSIAMSTMVTTKKRKPFEHYSQSKSKRTARGNKEFTHQHSNKYDK